MRKWCKRVSHALEGMCVLENGDDAFAPWTRKRVQRLALSVACGTNKRAYLIQVSDQRGTRLLYVSVIQRPTRGWPVSVSRP